MLWVLYSYDIYVLLFKIAVPLPYECALFCHCFYEMHFPLHRAAYFAFFLFVDFETSETFTTQLFSSYVKQTIAQINGYLHFKNLLHWFLHWFLRSLFIWKVNVPILRGIIVHQQREMKYMLIKQQIAFCLLYSNFILNSLSRANWRETNTWLIHFISFHFIYNRHWRIPEEIGGESRCIAIAEGTVRKRHRVFGEPWDFGRKGMHFGRYTHQSVELSGI